MLAAVRRFLEDRLARVDSLQKDVEQAVDEDSALALLRSLDNQDLIAKRVEEIESSLIGIEQEAAIQSLSMELENLNFRYSEKEEYFQEKELEYLRALTNVRRQAEVADDTAAQLRQELLDRESECKELEEILKQREDKIVESERLLKESATEAKKKEQGWQKEKEEIIWRLKQTLSDLESAKREVVEERAERERAEAIWQQRIAEERKNREADLKMVKEKAKKERYGSEREEGDWEKQAREAFEVEYRMKLIEAMSKAEEDYNKKLVLEAEIGCKSIANEYSKMIENLRSAKHKLEDQVKEKDQQIFDLETSLNKLKDKLDEQELLITKTIAERDYWKEQQTLARKQIQEQTDLLLKASVDNELLERDLKLADENRKDRDAAFGRLKEDYLRIEKLLADWRYKEGVQGKEKEDLKNKIEQMMEVMENNRKEKQEREEELKKQLSNLQEKHREDHIKWQNEKDSLKKEFSRNLELEKNRTSREEQDKSRKLLQTVSQKHSNALLAKTLEIEKLYSKLVSFKQDFETLKTQLHNQTQAIANWSSQALKRVHRVAVENMRGQEIQTEKQCAAYKSMFDLALKAEEGKTFQVMKKVADKDEEISDLRIGKKG